MIIGKANDCYSNLKGAKNMAQDGEKKLPLNFRINELEFGIKRMKGSQTGSKEDGKKILQQFSKCGLGAPR